MVHAIVQVATSSLMLATALSANFVMLTVENAQDHHQIVNNVKMDLSQFRTNAFVPQDTTPPLININASNVELDVHLANLETNVIPVNQDILLLIQIVFLTAQLEHSMLEINVRNAQNIVATVQVLFSVVVVSLDISYLQDHVEKLVQQVLSKEDHYVLPVKNHVQPVM